MSFLTIRLGLAWVGEKLVTFLVTVAGVSETAIVALANMHSILRRLERTVNHG